MSTKYGLFMLGGATTAQKISVLNLTGRQYIRPAAITLSDWSHTTNQYNGLISAGFKCVQNFIWTPTNGVAFRTSSQLSDYGSKLTSCLNTIYRPEVAVIENEETNLNYYGGAPLADYIGMLSTAITIAHAKGIKIMDGGIHPVGVGYFTYLWLVANGFTADAAHFKSIVFNSSMNQRLIHPTSSPSDYFNKIDYLLTQFTSLDVDYVNLHCYAPLNNNNASLTDLAWCIQKMGEYLFDRTGKIPASNEAGLRDCATANMAPFLQGFMDGGFEYMMLTTNLTSGTQDCAITDSSFALNALGDAYNAFFAGSSLINISVSPPSPYNIVLPTSSITLTASSTTGGLTWLWEFVSGPTGSTIVSPTSATTDITGLVEGDYVFRITGDSGTDTGVEEVPISVTTEAIVISSGSFDDAKAEILSKVGKLEICDNYHEVVSSTTFLELLQAGCGVYAWAYQTDVITDELLDSFLESDLNQYGVYKEDATLVNPQASDYLGCHGYFLEVEEAPAVEPMLHFVKDSNYSLTLDGNNKMEAYAMGDTIGEIVLSGNAKLNLNVFNAAVANITLSDNAQLCIQLNNTASVTITANDKSVVDISQRFKSTVGYIGNDTSSAIVRIFAKSSLSYTVVGTATINILQYGKPVISEI